jgi:SH3-like domain-containing protein
LRWATAGAAAAAVSTLLYIAAPEIKALIPQPRAAVAVAPAQAAETAPAQPTAPLLSVAAEFGNLRAEPSTSAPIVARLERGTQVVATERRSNWVRAASTDGLTVGWIHSSLLRDSLPTGD